MRALLIGEHDTDLLRFWRGLEDHGWQVGTAAGMEYLGIGSTTAPYDMVIMAVDAVESKLQILLDAIREHSDETVIMVLGEFSVDERRRALNLGADDFLGRDTPATLLLSRVLALLRLRAKHFQSSYLIGDLAIDLLHRQVIRSGREITLSQREFQLLVLLARHAGQTLSRSEIIEQLWGQAQSADDNVLDAHVSRLRRKLDKPFERHMICTVRGVGFRLASPDLSSPDTTHVTHV